MKQAFAQQAAEGLNEGFGEVSGQLRAVLDAIWATTKGIDWFFCMAHGFFAGYENIGGC